MESKMELALVLTAIFSGWRAYLYLTSRQTLRRDQWYSDRTAMIRGGISWLLGFGSIISWYMVLLS